MIYATTRRALWNAPATTVRFGLTTLLLGIGITLLTSTATALRDEALISSGGALCRVLIAAVAAKLLFEALVFLRLRDRQQTPLRRSALLMCGPLRRAVQSRYVCGITGGLVLPALLLSAREPMQGGLPIILAAGSFLTLLAGEFFERYLFFAAVVRRKMPGGLAP
jgi:DMSO reductase anchor subunit